MPVIPLSECDPHMSQYDHCQEPSWWSDGDGYRAYVTGYVRLKVYIPVDADRAERADGDEREARMLLEDMLDRMDTFGRLDDVTDTYDATDAEIVWEAERCGIGTARRSPTRSCP